MCTIYCYYDYERYSIFIKQSSLKTVEVWIPRKIRVSWNTVPIWNGWYYGIIVGTEVLLDTIQQRYGISLLFKTLLRGTSRRNQ